MIMAEFKLVLGEIFGNISLSAMHNVYIKAFFLYNVRVMQKLPYRDSSTSMPGLHWHWMFSLNTGAMNPIMRDFTTVIIDFELFAKLKVAENSGARVFESASSKGVLASYVHSKMF